MADRREAFTSFAGLSIPDVLNALLESPFWRSVPENNFSRVWKDVSRRWIFLLVPVFVYGRVVFYYGRQKNRTAILKRSFAKGALRSINLWRFEPRNQFYDVPGDV